MKTRKFHRERNQRLALLKSLSVALILKGKIKTTLARAKELRSVAEKLVTRAKGRRVPSTDYREVKKFLSAEAARKLIKEIGPKYKERNGGYTRIIRLLPRRSDAAKMAIIEFV